MIDKTKHAQLRRVISQANLTIKGDAIVQIASLLAWYDSLVEKPPVSEIKPIENPIGGKGAD